MTALVGLRIGKEYLEHKTASRMREKSFHYFNCALSVEVRKSDRLFNESKSTAWLSGSSLEPRRSVDMMS